MSWEQNVDAVAATESERFRLVEQAFHPPTRAMEYQAVRFVLSRASEPRESAILLDMLGLTQVAREMRDS